MSYETILLTRDGDVATLTLNRPASLNAITRRMVRELIAAFAEVDQDESVRALILTGAGKAFCAGFDLKEIMLNPARTVEQRKRLTEHEKRMSRGLWELNKPVVGRVHGPAIGGGLGLAMLCDFVVASDEARFGEPEILFGGGPGITLAWLVNMRKARQLVLLGEILTAEQALELELINQVVPLDELDETVMSLARRLAQLSPVAMTHAKQALRKVYEIRGFWDAYDYSRELFNLARMAPDPDRDEFSRIVETQGIKAAVAWRESRRAARVGDE